MLLAGIRERKPEVIFFTLILSQILIVVQEFGETVSDVIKQFVARTSPKMCRLIRSA